MIRWRNGPGWLRSLETDVKEEGKLFIEDAPLAVGTGAMDLYGWKAENQMY